MNFFVNLLKILIILVVVAVGVVVILMGAMVLFPAFSVFGIHYVNGDAKSIIYYYDVTHAENVTEWAQVDTLYIETNTWDVYVYSNAVAKDKHTPHGIDIKMNRNYIGFASNSVSEAALSKYTYEERKDGNYLSVYMTEPTGWLNKIDASLYVYLDPDTLQNKNLKIKTNGGKVVLGESVSNNSHTINFDSVIVEAGSGLAYVQDVNIRDSLVITKASGNINVSKDLTCDVEIDITSGLGNAYLRNVGTAEDPKDFVIEDMLNSGIYFDTIYGNALIRANSGLIKGNLITKTVVMDAESCNLEVGEVRGNLFFNNKNGSLKVDKANVLVATVTDKGNIYAKELYGESMIDGANGYVTVDDVYQDLFVTTTNGNITLNNKEGQVVDFVVESTNGTVKVTNINGSMHYNTNDKGKAQFKASYVKLIGENSINTYSGAIEIDMLDAGYGFMLKDWQTTNSVYFKLSRFEEFKIKDSSAFDAYKYGVRIGGYAGNADTLSVTSHVGSIRVVHPYLA